MYFEQAHIRCTCFPHSGALVCSFLNYIYTPKMCTSFDRPCTRGPTLTNLPIRPSVPLPKNEILTTMQEDETTNLAFTNPGSTGSNSYWLWSLIIFLMQRSLLSAVFIPHEVFTPQKYVHSSTRGSAEGGYPLCGVRGGYPPGWGVWGQEGPQRGFGGEAPEAKIAL
jgi:hypothetical protein